MWIGMNNVEYVSKLEQRYIDKNITSDSKWIN